MRRRKTYRKYLLSTLFLCVTGALWAQPADALGSFTPYSMFGLGEVARQGTAFNRAMGGIGVGVRDTRYINYLNPAAITARELQAFMLDFGAEGQNNYLSEHLTSSAYNSFNMHHVVVSFPLYRQAAMVLGICPYSYTGYNFEKKEYRPELVSELGDVAYRHYG